MKKYSVLEKIKKEKLLAVVRLEDTDLVERTVESLYNGGITVMELSFTMPYAHTLLEKISKKYGDKIVLGAGTVLDAETARIAILSGANFIVCPCFSESVIKTCNRYGVPVISGFDGISDIPKALELGVETFKLFPAEHYGVNYIKDIKGPFPNVEIMAMGGITDKNAKAWLDGGAFAVGISGAFMNPAKGKDFIAVEKTAKALLNEIR